LHSLSNIIRVSISRRIRWAGYETNKRENRSVYTVLVGKHQGKRLLGTPRYRWQDNIQTDLTQTGQESVDWIHLIQRRTSCGVS